MGRGLSYLQRQILCLAFARGFVTSSEMIEEFWGLQYHKQVSKETAYASAHASLSRTLSRLYWRGLIEYWEDKLSHYKTAITLTEVGKSMAETIILDEKESG